MQAKHSSGMGKEHEEHVVNEFAWANAWRSRSSGASFNAPIDVTTDVSVIECEATENKSYSLKLSFWDEIVQKQHSGKLPMLAIRFRDAQNGKHTDLLILDLGEGSALLEEVEVYRDNAVNRDR